MSGWESHRVGVVVFVTAPGVDQRDAEAYAQAAVKHALIEAAPGDNKRVVPFKDREIKVADTVALGWIADSSFVTITPSANAYRY